VTVDAEGGFYHRLKEKYGFGPATPATEMGERNDLGFTHSAAGAIAAQLADVGIDMNIAPVLDLLNPSKPDGECSPAQLRLGPERCRRARS